MNVVLACAACNGDPTSPMTAGTKWGIVALIGVIVTVLFAFASLFLFWMRRAKALERELGEARALASVERVIGDEPSIEEPAVWRVEEGASERSLN